MCCTRLAENTGRKNDAKNRHLGTIAQLCRAISSQLRHVSTIGKNLLSSNISSRCSHNMVNFGLLAAEIVSLVWGTPANFNGFRVFACSVTARQSSGERQPNSAALNRGRHLCSAGRPSRWALAHILVTTKKTTKYSLRPPYVIGQAIIFLPCDFYLSFFFPRLISAVGDWMSIILPHIV